MSFARYSPHGHPVSDGAGGLAPHDVATVAALKALPSDHFGRVHGNVVTVRADGSKWKFHETSTVTGDDILVITPTNGSGRWLRCEGMTVLKLPFSYATADGATLLTVSTGCVFHHLGSFWDITTGLTGGSSSAIGVASSINATAGDLLGGASGDVAATLTAGIKAGTIGAKMDALSELHANLYTATSTITFERITSAFTAGEGYVCLLVNIYKNAGA